MKKISKLNLAKLLFLISAPAYSGLLDTVANSSVGHYGGGMNPLMGTVNTISDVVQARSEWQIAKFMEQLIQIEQQKLNLKKRKLELEKERIQLDRQQMEENKKNDQRELDELATLIKNPKVRQNKNASLKIASLLSTLTTLQSMPTHQSELSYKQVEFQKEELLQLLRSLASQN